MSSSYISHDKGGNVINSVNTSALTEMIMHTSDREFVNVGGDSITGPLNFTQGSLINMNHNKIINLGDPKDPYDTVNLKTLEEKLKKLDINYDDRLRELRIKLFLYDIHIENLKKDSVKGDKRLEYLQTRVNKIFSDMNALSQDASGSQITKEKYNSLSNEITGIKSGINEIKDKIIYEQVDYVLDIFKFNFREMFHYDRYYDIYLKHKDDIFLWYSYWKKLSSGVNPSKLRFFNFIAEVNSGFLEKDLDFDLNLKKFSLVFLCKKFDQEKVINIASKDLKNIWMYYNNYRNFIFLNSHKYHKKERIHHKSNEPFYDLISIECNAKALMFKSEVLYLKHLTSDPKKVFFSQNQDYYFHISFKDFILNDLRIKSSGIKILEILIFKEGINTSPYTNFLKSIYS